MTPEQVDKLIDFGKMALEQGWYDEAREYFEQALALDASNREAMKGLARVNEILSRKAAAAAEPTRVEPVRPQRRTAQKRSIPKKRMEGRRSSPVQWFTERSRLGKLAVVVSVPLLLLCLCAGLASLVSPTPETPTPVWVTVTLVYTKTPTPPTKAPIPQTATPVPVEAAPTPKPVEAPPTPIPPTPMPTPLPTPTATPLPTPSSKPAFEILSHVSYEDTIGFLHMVGEIRNNTDATGEFIEIAGTFYDEAGRVVGTSFTYTTIDFVPAGGKSPFEIVSEKPQGYHHYKLQVSGRRTSELPLAGLQILSHSSSVDSIGFLHIVGEVQNNSGKDVEFVKIIATLYNAAGQVIGAGFTYTTLDVVATGQTSPFELVFDHHEGMAAYELQVEGKEL